MKLHMNDCYKCKKVALHSVTKIEGIDSLTVNMKENTLTVTGDADPVCVANLLRKKFRCAEVVSVGPVPQAAGGKEGGGGKGGEGGKGKGGGEGKDKGEGGAKGGEGKDKGGGGAKGGEGKDKGGGGGKGGGAGEGKGSGGGGTVCVAQCHPPCLACSGGREILWPRHYDPYANPREVLYVWDEDKQDSCAIM